MPESIHVEERNMEKVIAAFDLEGTLFRRSNFIMHEIRNSRKRGITGKVKVAIFDVSLRVIYICYKMHLISEIAMRTITIKRMAALLKGSSERDIVKQAKIFASKYTGLLRPEISRVLASHKSKGHITIMFSGMPQPYIEAIRQELGIDIALGTEREIKDGYYTGRLNMIPCFAEKRAQALSEIISKLDSKINFDKSFAYGDAILDRYFMEMTGNPVAVYPDKKLSEYAKEHDWRIIT